MASFFQQYVALTKQGFRTEFSEKERLVSPLLFAITVLLLFNFVLGEFDVSYKIELFIAETFFTALMALQLSFSRLFEPESQDHAFEILRTYPVDGSAWYLAKTTQVLVTGVMVAFSTILISGFFHQDPIIVLIRPEIFAITFLALLGMAPLGVLISAMTMKTSARQILYPLLYFPLTVPVLLAAAQSTLLIYNPNGLGITEPKPWIILLVCFDVVYFTLGFLLFGELTDDI